MIMSIGFDLRGVLKAVALLQELPLSGCFGMLWVPITAANSVVYIFERDRDYKEG
jgi:hypothetical protein